MAVTRCPYCKAIIDEEAQYCANCGTQLLFPEDEHIEEEVPGDKITDEELEEEKDDELEEELEEEEKLDEKEDLFESSKDEEIEWKKDFIPKKESEKEEKAEEELIRRKKLEELIGGMEEKISDKEDRDEILGIPKKLPKEESDEMGGIGEKEDSSLKEEGKESKEELPPWAEEIKEIPHADLPKEVEEREEDFLQSKEEFKGSDEEIDTDEELVVNSGVGVPEGDLQRGLPFEEKELDGEIESDERFQPPSRFNSKVKARVFDVFLITSFWLVTIWLASQLTEVSLFKLISVSALAITIFYLILLISYFCLFLFFLGRTLGDRLFLQES